MDDSAKKYLDVYCDIEAIFEESGIDPATYLINPTKDTPMVHAKILEVLAGSILDTHSMMALIMNNRSRLISIYNKYKDQASCHAIKEFNINRVIKSYLLDMYGYFFKVKDGKIEYTHEEDFVLPSRGRYADTKANYDYIDGRLSHMSDGDKELALILTRDGAMYYAPYDHQSLACWLNLNGVNLKNAIRVEATKKLGEFCFTSLHNYMFSLDSDGDVLVPISYDQAENLGDIYAAINRGWKYMKPIEKSLRNSTGFGIGKTEVYDQEGVSGNNMRKLAMYVPELNVLDYVRELKSASTVHDTMAHSYTAMDK